MSEGRAQESSNRRARHSTVAVRRIAATHAVTMMQVERWLEGASTSPNEGIKKAKVNDLLLALILKLSRQPDCRTQR